MEDRYFFGIVVYLVLSSFFMGIMPDSLFTGKPEVLDVDDTVDELPTSSTGLLDIVSSAVGIVGFFVKVNIFLFLPIVIQGLPLVITSMLQLLHIFLIIVLTIYGFDKARGIGG